MSVTHLESKRSEHWSIWKSMKLACRCFAPLRMSSSRSKENSAAATATATASKVVSINSPRGLPSPDHSYSAMNAEERDENLKEVITYCNKSMKKVS
ncbi:hypothetical protein ERO13_A07G009750v2 [Gossypium hirsutum]|uniref:Uncharacterized protein n=2 Tax=Gossypium TaxID=3633 RepID=A0A5J5UY29_GOSBA|nr:hypothetical protein ES319_A07G011200v1 [Gossypium barbadense]KAG4190091.1 hypothetical protein ERO13_A07G009750v2 [Gossypium hirsutum]TYJ24895.1 hypothetical protein E1A91_A07G010300v1 [Gossypium mustelinum]